MPDSYKWISTKLIIHDENLYISSMMKKNSTLFLVVLFVFIGCKNVKTEPGFSIPKDLKNMDNLTVFSPDSQEADTITFEQVATFESNAEIFLEGYIRSFAIDDAGRVYIAATQPGLVGIYVFNPNGSYRARFTRHGRGPGEYESIGSIDIYDDKLYLLDPGLQKIGIFSLKDYSHIKDEVITREKLHESDSLAQISGINKLYVRDEEEFIIKMKSLPRSRKQASQKELFYRLEPDGKIKPGKLLELRGLTYYFPPKGEVATPMIMPFHRSDLVSVTKGGFFYTARTEHFLVKKYDPRGTYLSGFYYPLGNAPFSKDAIHVERQTERILGQYKLPETWPVLHTMEVDDEGRIWVATISEDDSSFLWWVLDRGGNVLGWFVLPGKRSERAPYEKPLIMIKRGYFYTHERDFRTGIERIVKYRIDFNYD